ncbi:MAG TPA: nucleotide pyrophosphatase/phosphodiesterase family protein [Tepidisphaeraceae bacterium]|jgi:predicted AlkP superfamily pyrophosphatase or phosphodiesterase|nr:nucleotide pyrophosphatase/phosphodiesterase family protein [Tepidisphaeraceae bacterium]
MTTPHPTGRPWLPLRFNYPSTAEPVTLPGTVHKTVVLNVVGLTPDLIGPHTPRLAAFAKANPPIGIGHVLPAVTCSVQSTYLTGKWPAEHGIVGNGWYFRDECEVKFWRQSNKLVQSPKLWEMAKAIDPTFTCANHFWWYNMYSSVDYSVTPRPMYPADGRKVPDVYTHPTELRDELQATFGTFPLFQFWGPATDIKVSQWIADAAIHTDRKYDPTLTLIYLPHLDYGLQRHGPDLAKVATDLADIDRVCGGLIDHYQGKNARIVILSEYGIYPVSRPIHINRLFRERGWIAVRREMGRDVFDAGASRAFAAVDHQLAHVYVNDGSILNDVRALLESTPGVAQVLDRDAQQAVHLNHDRSGELVAVADHDAWFTYYYWLYDADRPDYANTVDIHRKPGYDPVELFLDPAIRNPKLKIGLTLAKKKLGMRTLMEVIPTDATLVKGSHGVAPRRAGEGPMLMTNARKIGVSEMLPATDVCNVLMRHLID